MRSKRIWILPLCTALLAGAAGIRLLHPADENASRPISVGTTDVAGALDPAGAYDTGSWAIYSNLYQSLLTLKPGSAAPVPDAAQTCGFLGPSLMTYECTLRKGLKFANGHPMTADDVRYSFERMLSIASDTGPALLFPALDSVTARGRKITFHLRDHDATFPLKLATAAGSIIDRTHYPKDALRPGTSVHGSGPYTLTEYTPGVRALLKPNPHYRGAAQVPKTPVEVRYYAEGGELATAWRRGDVDVAHRQLPPQMTATYDPNKEGGRITEAAGTEIRTVVFDMRPASAMARREVRQAIAVLVDRGRIMTEVHRSTVEPLYSLIPRNVTGHTTSFFDTYDRGDDTTKRARRMLREADVPIPVTFTYAHRAGETHAAEAEELRRQLEKTGLYRMKIVSKEWKHFQEGYFSGAYDAYGLSWAPDFPDPDNFTSPLVGHTNVVGNTYTNARVNRLITNTQRHSDRKKTAATFREIQKEIAADVPLLPLWQKKEYVLASETMAGSQHLSDGTGIWRLWQLRRI
ncbi:ABC transporter substrate-binding protein [Streptomyces microflavus]|uniref:ABC transporter substrate-binding protein n=1 Tax=Streptomyces microflavus TaxID=1919 RepID=UPI00344E8204